jgi:PIN domain nuclease of toxin-antitoxin system
MSFLLNTHTLLWAILNDNKLSNTAKKIITDTNNVCYFSIVSLWEITIKHSLGSLELNMTLNDCFNIITETGFAELSVSKNHLIELNKLPYYHKDPFDRLLIAQTIYEGLTIITRDGPIAKYNVPVVW